MASQKEKVSAEISERLGRVGVESLFRQLGADADVRAEGVRAVDVLLQVAAERPRWLTETFTHALADDVIPGLIEYDPTASDPSHPGDQPNRNSLLWYRRSCFISSLARVLEWSPNQRDWTSEESDSLEKVKRSAAAKLRQEGERLFKELMKASPSDHHGMHPFFVLQMVRSVQIVQDEPWKGFTQATKSARKKGQAPSPLSDTTSLIAELKECLKGKLKSLLAQHQLGLDNAGDSVALAFTAAGVAKLGSFPKRHTRAGLKACISSYRRSAGWEQGRVVCEDLSQENQPHRMAVPAAEVYSAVAEAALESGNENGFLDGEDQGVAPRKVLGLLDKGLQVADDSQVDRPGSQGWAVDQILGSTSVELWATAAVLKLALIAHELRHRDRRQRVLESRDAKPAWGDEWPSWLGWDKYLKESDPELDVKEGILEFIDSEIVKPRQAEPGKTQSKAVVTLLFGPPGTTKTTIARAVAGGLKWPLITLSPGNFINRGLEKVESQAGKIFDELEQLSRAVVIFDECDELFRTRAPVPQAESLRNVSAFITASMLPKLQDLHDRGRIVVFICTNFLDSIDPAMRRVGRIDHLIAVPPPNAAQRLATIRRELKLPAGDAEIDKLMMLAVEELAESTEHAIRGELINAARELEGAAPFQTEREARETAKQIGVRTGKTIEADSDSYRDFQRDLKELSEPHRRRDGHR